MLPNEPEDLDLASKALRDALLRAVSRYCPRALDSEREDLAQTALLRLLRLRRTGCALPLRSAYLRRVAYSVVVDELRRRRVRRELPLDEECLEVSVHSRSPELEASCRELETAVADCFSSMLETRRAALVLTLRGYSGPEVASLLATGTKRVENLLCRGKSDLRRLLGERGFADDEI